MKDKILHVDMSNKLHERKNIGIAWSTPDHKYHAGLCLRPMALKKLEQRCEIHTNHGRLYGILIFILLSANNFKQGFRDIIRIIICNDAPYDETIKALKILLKEHYNCEHIDFYSISQYRQDLNMPLLKSCADPLANAYRKRANNIHRHNKGYNLNVVQFNLSEIVQLWQFLEQK